MFSFQTGIKPLKSRIFTWERSLLFIKGILLSLGFAGITGLCARLRFYLPFTPVPVTGQVFAVLFSGLVLGKEYGSLSQIFYITFGLLGLPWFAIFPLVPTGGYLVGFIGAPYIIGYIIERSKTIKLKTILLSMLSGVFVIYLFGFIIFTISTGMGLLNSVWQSVLLFIPFDIGKAFVAAIISCFIIKKFPKFIDGRMLIRK